VKYVIASFLEHKDVQVALRIHHLALMLIPVTFVELQVLVVIDMQVLGVVDPVVEANAVGLQEPNPPHRTRKNHLLTQYHCSWISYHRLRCASFREKTRLDRWQLELRLALF
jgi:hypothetical protein